MRKFAKIMAVLLALALAAPCFAERKVVTKWRVTSIDGIAVSEESFQGRCYLIFYDDGSLELEQPDNYAGIIMTYIGDSTKNGSILIAGQKGNIKGNKLSYGDEVWTKVKE